MILSTTSDDVFATSGLYGNARPSRDIPVVSVPILDCLSGVPELLDLLRRHRPDWPGEGSGRCSRYTGICRRVAGSDCLPGLGIALRSYWGPPGELAHAGVAVQRNSMASSGCGFSACMLLVLFGSFIFC